MLQTLLLQSIEGNFRALARIISIVENEGEKKEHLLLNLPQKKPIPIIGITGSPGAGKSSLVNNLIKYLVNKNKSVGVLCIDPSSPFSVGALLGDRIRMNEWYNHPNVFIRSLATRGSLGGLTTNIIEIIEVMKAAPFDFIIIETVGVGQSEIEIASLADVTILVLVPEGGDEIQTMKSGILEIADVFVVNKSDRPNADEFAKNLIQMPFPALHKKGKIIHVIKTVATENQGTEELVNAVEKELSKEHSKEKHLQLLAEKCWQLIQKKKMKNVDKELLIQKIKSAIQNDNFNLHKIVNEF